MKLARIVPVLLSIAAARLLLGMSACECSTEPRYVDDHVRRIEAKLIDARGATPIISTAGSIPAAAFGLSVRIVDAVIGKRVALGTGLGKSAAIASESCDPGPVIPIMKDTIQSLTVTRLGKGGATSDAWSSFVAGRVMHPPYYVPGGPPLTSRDSVQAIQFAVDMLNGAFNVDLLLRENIEAMKGDGLRFILTAKLTNGTVFADTTDPVTLF